MDTWLCTRDYYALNTKRREKDTKIIYSVVVGVAGFLADFCVFAASGIYVWECIKLV